VAYACRQNFQFLACPLRANDFIIPSLSNISQNIEKLGCCYDGGNLENVLAALQPSTLQHTELPRVKKHLRKSEQATSGLHSVHHSQHCLLQAAEKLDVQALHVAIPVVTMHANH